MERKTGSPDLRSNKRHCSGIAAGSRSSLDNDGVDFHDPGDRDESDDSKGEEEEDDNMYDGYDDDTDDSDDAYAAYREVEKEVEERDCVLNATSGKSTLKLYRQQGGEDAEFEQWMQTIHVSCSHGGKVIGRAFGRYIKRDWIRSNFWTTMEEPSHDLSEVAFEVFDRYGRLKQEFKTHAVRKGSGCWGDELDLGSLFVIEHLQIEKEWRRKGVGKTIVTALINKAQTGGRIPAFNLVVPGWLNHDIEVDTMGMTNSERRGFQLGVQTGVESFYRSLGFRRIGASCCFGLAIDPAHKAHELPIDSDFEPTAEEAEGEDPDAGVEEDDANSLWDYSAAVAAEKRAIEALKTRLPLHHATLFLPDAECVDFYKEFKKERGTIAEFWRMDRSDKNVLHLAACELKVESVQWLLRNANENFILSSARNIEGYTPVEALEAQLEERRTTLEMGGMTACISDKFKGFPGVAVECLSALHSLTALSDAQMLRIKFGCTCGHCIDGYMSPRMRFALLCQAEIQHDMLDMFIEDGEAWCEWHDYMFSHVAPDIQQNFKTNKSLRRGFANIFNRVATVLRANRAPTIINILAAFENSSEWPPVTKSFYQRGGKTESVLRKIFDFARDQDEWAGDGTHMETFEDDINALPPCRNDHEFGFVALACGV